MRPTVTAKDRRSNKRALGDANGSSMVSERPRGRRDVMTDDLRSSADLAKQKKSDYRYRLELPSSASATKQAKAHTFSITEGAIRRAIYFLLESSFGIHNIQHF